MSNPALDPLSPPDPAWAELPKMRSAEYALTRDDLIATFQEPAPEGVKKPSLFWRAFPLVALVSGAGGLVMLFFLLPGANIPRGEVVAGTGNAIFLLIFGVIVLRARFGGRQRIEKGVDKLLAKPDTGAELVARRRITIAPRGCLTQVGSATQVYTWPAILHVRSTEEHCFLIAERNLVIATIPRRAFGAETGFCDSCRQFKDDAERRNSSEEVDAVTAVETGSRANSPQPALTTTSPVIETADAEPRPLCTPAERFGLSLVTRGFPLSIAAAVVSPLGYLLVAANLGWPLPPGEYILGAFVLLGVGWLLGLVYDKRCPGLPRRRYLGWRTARILACRPQRVVSPGEPGAFFVQVVPRERWPIPMMEDATDRGWLAVDRANARLLFEGVRERWIIPVACLETCSRFEFQGNMLTVYVILVVREGERIVEIPLRTFDPAKVTHRDEDKRQEAAALFEAVESLKVR